MMADNFIRRENLAAALAEAIDSRKEKERDHFATGINSCLVDGWQEVLDAVKAGKLIEVRE